jgi:hypothetical protein
VKFGALATLLAVSTALLPAQPREPRRPLPDAAPNGKTGPAVGERIPPFRLKDQYGNEQTVASLRGRHGLLLAFVRSADW